MKATITQVRRPRDARDFRKSSTRFTAYTDGKARDVAGREYLDKFGLSQYNFRIVSWGRVAGVATEMEAVAVKAAVETNWPGTEVEVKFSRKAGCPCGCSPGYVGKIIQGGHGTDKDGNTLNRADVWLTEDDLTADETATIVAYAAKQAVKLPAEIAAGEAKLAAEKAAKEAQRIADDKANEERRARWEAQQRRWAEQSADESLACAAI